MRFGTSIAVLGVSAVLAAASPALAKTRALVIGINEYPGILVDGAAGQRDLRGAVNDARNMAQALEEHFDVGAEEIRLLVDSDATREGILSAFRTWLIDETTAGDRVIFYYAGHGAQVEDTSGDEGDDRFDEVLAPQDVHGELEGPDAGLSGFITDDEIDALLAALSGRQVLMIVDACHAGTITRGALELQRVNASMASLGTPGADRPDSGAPASEAPIKKAYSGVRTLTPNGALGALDELESLGTREAHRLGTRLIQVVEAPPDAQGSAGPELAVWTATASAQLAVEDLGLGGSEGLFTNRFVKGLAQREADLNGNGKVTAAELLSYLRSEAEQYCSNYACGAGGLTPTLEAWTGYDAEVLASGYDAGASAGGGSGQTGGYGETIASSDVLPEQGYDYLGGVTVSLSGAGRTPLGEKLRVKVESEHAGELIVLDVRDDGTTVQLFPNSPSLAVGAETRIAAGGTRSIPADLDPFELVPDSRGAGRIVALVVDPRVPTSTVTDTYLDLEPIPSPEAYVAAISRQLNRTVTYPVGSEYALEQPAAAGTLARGEARYVIY